MNHKKSVRGKIDSMFGVGAIHEHTKNRNGYKQDVNLFQLVAQVNNPSSFFR